jgi:hypothetical protein
MRISFVAIIAAAFALQGCSSAAHLPSSDPVSEQEVFMAIACDLRTAVDQDASLEDWGANVTVVFDRKLDLTVKPQGEWKVALASLSIDAQPSSEVGTSGENNLPLTKTYESFSDPLKAGKSINQDCPIENPGTFSNGLGIGAALQYDWNIVKAAPPDVQLVHDKPNIAKYVRSFSVKHVAGGSLSFTLGPVTVKTDGSSASTGMTNTIEVDFAYARPKPPGVKKKGPSVKQILDDYRTQDRQQQILTNAIEQAVPPAG